MELYYRAHDVHELLVHRAAEQSGAYEQAGVVAELKDGSGARWQQLEATAPLTIGVGGVIVSRLLKGTSWVVVCVNTQYPLFWLVSQPSIERIEDLRGKRVAGRPLTQAPSIFLRIIFRRHGLDISRDCTYLIQEESEAGIELLRKDEVEASFVNVPPFELERAGYRVLAFYGSEFQTTTTGLAVNQDVLPADAPEVRQLVEVHRSTLARLHQDRDLAVRAIADLEPVSGTDAGLLYDRYIRPYWTTDGRPDWQIAERSLTEVARELGADRVPTIAELYRIP